MFAKCVLYFLGKMLSNSQLALRKQKQCGIREKQNNECDNFAKIFQNVSIVHETSH